MAQSNTWETSADGASSSGYVVGQHNIQAGRGMFRLDVHKAVFPFSAAIIVLFVVLTMLFTEHAANLFGWLRPAVTSTFDWFFCWLGTSSCWSRSA
jgi:BCCT family betaine/carnitine transporter